MKKPVKLNVRYSNGKTKVIASFATRAAAEQDMREWQAARPGVEFWITEKVAA